MQGTRTGRRALQMPCPFRCLPVATLPSGHYASPPAPIGRQFFMATGLSAIFLHNRPALLRFLRARGAGDESAALWQDQWVKLEEMDLGQVADPLPNLSCLTTKLMLDRYPPPPRPATREQGGAGGAGDG